MSSPWEMYLRRFCRILPRTMFRNLEWSWSILRLIRTNFILAARRRKTRVASGTEVLPILLKSARPWARPFRARSRPTRSLTQARGKLARLPCVLPRHGYRRAMDLSGIGKLVLVFGLSLAGLGVLLIVVGKGLLPHLPGDLSFKVGSVRVFFPLATSILLSIVLTLVLNLFFRR